jgi:ribosome maturation factor RimP
VEEVSAMAGGTVDRVQALVAPVLADLGLEIYDLEHAGGIVRVTVDRDGGIDLEGIALATRLISRELDHADPLPGRYTLEVTSPGLERNLRTPAHFARAVGSTVAVRTHPHVEGDRRVQGTLRAADGAGIDVTQITAAGPTERRLAYDDIERARTVFEWGGQPKAAARPRPVASTSRQRKAAAS